jgi:hypothetical protein
MAGHTNENAYKILYNVRIDLNEYSAGLWAGTETHGKYSNTYLLNKMNDAQARMVALMLKADAREFYYSTSSVSVVSSVITLPYDFGRIMQLEDSQGYKVYPSTAKITPVTGAEGSDNLYYRSGRTLVLNKAGVTDTYTLKYFRQPRKLTWGAATAGSGLNSLILAASDLTSGRNDYYNNLTIDNYTQGLSATISDYVGSTRTATTATTAITWATSDIYGTVPDLPDELHGLVEPLTVIMVKQLHPASQEKPGATELKLWAEQFMEALVAYSNQPDDISMESIFTDFQLNTPGMAIDVPGQGYLIQG